VDQNDNPTPPAESAQGTPHDEPEGRKGTSEPREGARPSVSDLLSAARGEPVRRAPVRPTADAPSRPAAERTVVPPSARLASSGTVGESAPAGDTPDKEVPAATPPAARVAPTGGAAKTASTPTPAISKGVTKAAAKPPAGPLVQSAPDTPINKLRRRIIWGAIIGFMGVWSMAFFRFFLARTVFEPSSIFRIGFPGDYSLGVDTKWQQQHRIWVVKNSERLFVIYAKCTHLGCTPDWKASENKFKCPCHGSGYDSEGVNFEGPAPRPMDRAHVKLDPEGQIVVDTNRLYDWPKGGTKRFDEGNGQEGAFVSI
jgi:cytochrome b6-f complex iron-sulfur subunit